MDTTVRPPPPSFFGHLGDEGRTLGPPDHVKHDRTAFYMVEKRMVLFWAVKCYRLCKEDPYHIRSGAVFGEGKISIWASQV